MKISINNINKYLQKSLSTEEIVYAFEQSEVEVEEILYANKLDEKVIVAKVVKVATHPNADRLKLVTVSTDAGKKTLVCGGSNVKVGLTVAFAQAGSILPDGTEITPTKIRGVDSEGMLCTELELGWGDDHSGIVELSPQLPAGKSLCDIENYGDVVDIKTPSNRWDYLSYVGLAREIAAVSEKNRLVEPKVGEYTYQNREVVNVKNREDCPAFYLVKASVKVPQKSPRWVVDNLEASGIRTINPVVDITNLVMLEYGQPSHAFDFDKIEGALQVRKAKSNESLTTLDGKIRKLSIEDLVIADDKGPLDIAGIMGGEKTEIGPNTTTIYLTVANFDKTTVRRASLRHGLRSEASNRFEKGLPLPLPHLAIRRLMDLLKEICNAEVLDGPFEQVYAHPPNPWLGMKIRRAEKFLGYQLDEKQVMDGLKKRGFAPSHFSFTKESKEYMGRPYKQTADAWSDGLEAFDSSYLTQTILGKASVSLPRIATSQYVAGHEVELSQIKPGDLLFLNDTSKTKDQIDVGMYIGNKKVLQASPKLGKVGTFPIALFTKARGFKGVRRYIDGFNHIISVEVPWWRTDVTAEVDLFEETAKIVGYDAMPETLPQLPATSTVEHQTLLRLMDLRRVLVARGLQEVYTYSFVSKKDLEIIGSEFANHLQIENPLSSEQDYLRSNLLSSHLWVVANNQRNYSEGSIFELSRVFMKKNTRTSEEWVLGITTWGDQSLLKLKGILDVVGENYRLTSVFETGNNPNYIAGRSGNWKVGKALLGEYGQVNPKVLQGWKIKPGVSFVQVKVSELLENQKSPTVKAPVPYQLVKREVSVQTNNDVCWADIQKVVLKQKDCVRVDFIDEFSDAELHASRQKRLHFRTVFDLGPNPTQNEIVGSLEDCYKLLLGSKELGKLTIT